MSAERQYLTVMLQPQDIDFIVGSTRFPRNLRRIVREGADKTPARPLRITLPVDEADALREIAADLLEELGFDEKYQPTETGKILEHLIDIFHDP